MHPYDAHAFADGEARHEDADSIHSHSHSHHHDHDHRHQHLKDDQGNEWGLDDDTLREYERRYKRERELEKRPTLGDSVLGMVRALGGRRG